MFSRKDWIGVMAVVCGAIGWLPDADAQIRVTVQAQPTVEALAGPAEAPPKLSPDLQVAVSVGAKFLGTTEQGEAVLEFVEAMDFAETRAALADAPGVVAVEEMVQDRFDRIDELIVIYQDEQALQREAIADLRIVDRHEPGRFVVIRSEDGFSSDELTNLVGDETVRFVEPNYLYRLDEPSSPPDDPLYLEGKLWGLENINAPTAWQTVTKSPIIVAVIDTGVDYTHEDLDKNMWKNSSGKHGHDFVNDDDDPKDGHSHGTHCAGTIAAVGNNGKGVVGVTWEVQIMAVQIFSASGGFAGASKVAQAIDFAVDNGAKVLSNSWSGPNPSVAIKSAINRSEEKDTLFVAAASNNFGSDNDVHPRYPASYDNKNIIAVLSIDRDDKLSSFSNIGKLSVDIGAPGGSVLSTVLDNTYAVKSGTSMATPHVAGAAALVWGHPDSCDASALQVKKLLLDHARPLPDLAGKCVTGGTLNLEFLGSTGKQPKQEAVASDGEPGAHADCRE